MSLNCYDWLSLPTFLPFRFEVVKKSSPSAGAKKKLIIVSCLMVMKAPLPPRNRILTSWITIKFFFLYFLSLRKKLYWFLSRFYSFFWFSVVFGRLSNNLLSINIRSFWRAKYCRIFEKIYSPALILDSPLIFVVPKSRSVPIEQWNNIFFILECILFSDVICHLFPFCFTEVAKTFICYFILINRSSPHGHTHILSFWRVSTLEE